MFSLNKFDLNFQPISMFDKHHFTILCFLFISLCLNAQLEYGAPESVGLDSKYIQTKVDSIMALAITEEAFPGAQLLVAKQGKIIFHKAYGYHTYDSIQK